MVEFVEADVGYANAEKLGQAKKGRPAAVPVLNVVADKGVVAVELADDIEIEEGYRGDNGGSNRTS